MQTCLLTLLISLQLSVYFVCRVRCDKCPSIAFTYCADEGAGNICIISDTIKEGLISFGSHSGHFEFIPFTNENTDGTDFEFECKVDYTNSQSGRACCFMDGNTGFGDIDDYYGYAITRYAICDMFSDPLECTDYTTQDECRDFRAQDYTSQTTYDFTKAQYNSKPVAMRYGKSGRWVHRVISNAVGWCCNPFFGDPSVEEEYKECDWSQSFVPFSNDLSEWTQCEQGACVEFDETQARWFRYGDDNHYYYKLIFAPSGSVECQDWVFGADPSGSANNNCWYSDAFIRVTGITGQWIQLSSCFGCGPYEYSRTIGVSREHATERASEITSEWTETTENSMGGGIEFAGLGAGGSSSSSLSETVSRTLATSMSISLSQSVEVTLSVRCEKSAFYQWTVGATETQFDFEGSFSVLSSHFICVDSGKPQCPPGYCSLDDPNCQICNYPTVNPTNDPTSDPTGAPTDGCTRDSGTSSESREYCCDSGCGFCAGSGCHDASNDNNDAYICCSSQIREPEYARDCALNPPPCLIGVGIGTNRNCEFGLANSQNTHCCHSGCGQCGGVGCADGANTNNGEYTCCGSHINSAPWNGRSCELNPPPCVMSSSSARVAFFEKDGYEEEYQFKGYYGQENGDFYTFLVKCLLLIFGAFFVLFVVITVLIRKSEYILISDEEKEECV